MKNKDLKKLEKLEKGVTENAPYEDLAEYKMVTYLEEEQINSQST